MFDVNDQILEYKMTIRVDLELTDLVQDELIWHDPRLLGQTVYSQILVPPESERDAQERAAASRAR